MKTYLYSNNRVVIRDVSDLAFEPRISIDERLAAEIPDEIIDELIEERLARGERRARAGTERSLGIWDTPFVWYDHHFDAHLLADMSTAYIFFALRMVWNHSVPGWLRVGDKLRYYPDVPNWHPRYRQHAITEFTTEFNKRIPYESDIREQFVQMVERTDLILRLGI